MSSKLAYLSKYTNNDDGKDDTEGEEPSRKRKKKDKKRKRSFSKKKRVADHLESTVVDMDDDDWMLNKDDESMVENDAPVIVSGQQWKDEVAHMTGAETDDSSRGNASSSSSVRRGPKRRHDSLSSDDESMVRNRRRARHDSDSSDNDEHSSGGKGKTMRRRERHDSSSDDERTGRRHDSSSDDENELSRSGNRRMASGHTAGLQDASKFSKAEKNINEKKRRQLARMKDSGKGSETVYRGKDGRKIDMLQNFEEYQKEAARKLEKEQREKYETQSGFVQKMRHESEQKEVEKMKNAPFARGRNDDELEYELKNTLRAADPMYAMELKKREQKVSLSGKALYKGPAPKPNRFGIKPGYRWDGNARGNGFEDKVLAAIHGVKAKKERDYKYSVADM